MCVLEQLCPSPVLCHDEVLSCQRFTRASLQHGPPPDPDPNVLAWNHHRNLQFCPEMKMKLMERSAPRPSRTIPPVTSEAIPKGREQQVPDPEWSHPLSFPTTFLLKPSSPGMGRVMVQPHAGLCWSRKCSLKCVGHQRSHCSGSIILPIHITSFLWKKITLILFPPLGSGGLSPTEKIYFFPQVRFWGCR